MFQAYGLYSHIQANRLRSMLLLAGFVALLHALFFSVLLLFNAFGGGTFEDIIARSAAQFARSWPVAMLGAALWFVVAFLFHQAMIAMATGAKAVTREEAPNLYNALENLCISRGIPMPRLEMIETPAFNAYAAGLREGQYIVGVTRGLAEKLDGEELEAVLAHELTHIRNRDTQLMVIAVIFAGIFAFAGDLLIRGWDFPYGWSPRQRRDTDADEMSTRGDEDRGQGGGAALAMLVAVAIILVTWGISTLIRFALSRSREYLADAGAVELTKNPDALIRALRKIEKNAAFDVPSRMEAFFIENPVRARISGFFSTHPLIEDRVAALRKFAGGREEAVV